MTTIPFTKGQGTGNDFVVVEDVDNELHLTDHDVQRLCDRRFGVGSDGMLRVVRVEAEPEAAQYADGSDVEWFMDYRNADGSRAEMCGNGIRVFSRYLQTHHLAAFARGSSEPIVTRAGVKSVKASAVGFDVDMGRWRLDDRPVEVSATGLDVPRPGLGIDVGNPHVVVALAGERALAGLDLTVAPSLDPIPEHGANVEFVVPREPLVRDGVGYITMRVFERGVGETLSCGTGAVAAALATRYWAGPRAPEHWHVGVPGGELGVMMFAAEDGEHVSLSGPAELAFSSSIEL